MENLFGFSKEPMPSSCPDCKSKMGQIQYGIKFDSNYKQVSPSFVKNDSIYRQCNCGCVIIWGLDIEENPRKWNQVFMRRHILPLFDDKFILQIVDRN